MPAKLCPVCGDPCTGHVCKGCAPGYYGTQRACRQCGDPGPKLCADCRAANEAHDRSLVATTLQDLLDEKAVIAGKRASRKRDQDLARIDNEIGYMILRTGQSVEAMLQI